MPKSAWLVPFWKVKKQWLQTCITSIRNQNDRDFEVHLISDGCEDNNLLDDMGELADLDPRFHLWKHKHHGLIYALNFGLSVIDSQYIFRLDSDDFNVGQRMERQLAFMDASPDISICGGCMCDVDGKTKFTPSMPKRLTATSFSKVVKDNMTICFHPTWCMRRSDIYCYPRKYHHAEDIGLISTLILEGKKISNIPDIVTAHRLHPDRVSITHTEEQRHNALLAIKEILGKDLFE